MIKVRDLRKSYPNIEVLKGIDLTIEEGEIYGLLGPNGAGKTTTLAILSSILSPDSGEVEIDNVLLKNHADELKRIIGVVPQEIALYSELSALDNLLFWGKMYGISKKELLQQADMLLHQLGLEDRKRDPIKSYSGGMKRRINIAAALLHRPKVLFMDEPTVGIDPQSKNLIYQIIEELKKDGMTIIYTTHYMDEAERLCDCIGIIDNGKIITEGTVNELRSRHAVKEAMTVTFSQLLPNQAASLSEFWPDMKRVDNTIVFYSSAIHADMGKIIVYCNGAGLEITNIEVSRVNLEGIFLDLTGKQLRD